MSKSVELICDGCAKRVPWRKSGSGRPADWRSLRVTMPNGAQRVFDVCGVRCASKCVDSTYEEEDRRLMLVGTTDRLRPVHGRLR